MFSIGICVCDFMCVCDVHVMVIEIDLTTTPPDRNRNCCLDLFAIIIFFVCQYYNYHQFKKKRNTFTT